MLSVPHYAQWHSEDDPEEIVAANSRLRGHLVCHLRLGARDEVGLDLQCKCITSVNMTTQGAGYG